MLSVPVSEATLNEALADSLRNKPAVAAWFLSRTSFRHERALFDWCRFDNPWSTVQLDIPDAITGATRTLTLECETDVLAVYSALNGKRLGLHIENKLAGSRFTPNQPELYRARKHQWMGRRQFGEYTEGATVLIAPTAFYERNMDGAKQFDSYISHEDIAEHISVFATTCSPSF
jgi:hypothetical protein